MGEITIIGRVSRVQAIASGSGIREIDCPRKAYGSGWWRKRKGIALVRLPDGTGRHAEVNCYEAHGIGRKELNVICVANKGYRASLVTRRVYLQLPDPEAKKRRLLRVIDESGEDYLFPRDLFEAIDLPRTIERKLALVTT